MEKIMLPKNYEEKIDEMSSKFTIEPLFPGYGATLGNALRRVLLSSLPGAAITSFKIEGVSHEFSSIPHVKEDMVEIMLNLKRINIKMHGDEPITLSLTKKGPGEVVAADFDKNSECEVLNSDVHIATLDNKANFELSVTVEKNRGFKPVESKESGNEIGLIFTDADFSPVSRVKLTIENTRVGKMTNYEKVILEVKTDGSISPHAAMVEASTILIDHYKSFSFDEESSENLTEAYVEEKAVEEAPELLGGEEFVYGDVEVGGLDPKAKIEDASFSSRTTNALINAGIKTVAGLKRLSDLKLSEIKGLGQKGIDEIKGRLE